MHIAAQTEGLYLSLSATYPELIKAMQASIQESDRMLSSTASRGSSGAETTALTQLIDETKLSIDTISQNFKQTYESDVNVYQALSSQIEEVRNLGSFIEGIRDDSTNMELISLNAMTVALKAGGSGRAFSYITEELKRLSTKTIELTESITLQGSMLLNAFSAFSGRLKSLADMEEKMFGGFREQVGESFTGFLTGITSIKTTFGGLREKTAGVYTKLMKIMEEIQKQDLIRQSIDHIVISLEELQNIDGKASKEEKMNELAFMKALPELCLHVLEYIRGIVHESLSVFIMNIIDSETLIESIEQDRKNFLARTMDDKSPDSIGWHFKRSREALDRLFDDLFEAFQSKKNVVNHSSDIIKQVRSLDESFKSFSNLISRFHTIDVASRIEIAKQAVLRQMSGTVDEMTRLTKRIEEDVDKSISATSGFLGGVRKSLDNYRIEYVTQSRLVQNSTEKLRHKQTRLLASKDGLSESIMNYRLFTDEFLQRFQTSKDDLGKVRDLLEEIDAVQETLESIRDTASESLQDELNATGLQEWNISSSRLNEVISRFTIFTHKKAAGDLVGLAVEEGSAPGDIVLF